MVGKKERNKFQIAFRNWVKLVVDLKGVKVTSNETSLNSCI